MFYFFRFYILCLMLSAFGIILVWIVFDNCYYWSFEKIYIYILLLFFYCSLAPLVKKVNEDRVLEMTERLCDKLLNGKDQHRDIASIALKTIVSEVNTTAVAQRILVSLTPQLIRGITSAVSSLITF